MIRKINQVPIDRANLGVGSTAGGTSRVGAYKWQSTIAIRMHKTPRGSQQYYLSLWGRVGIPAIGHYPGNSHIPFETKENHIASFVGSPRKENFQSSKL